MFFGYFPKENEIFIWHSSVLFANQVDMLHPYTFILSIYID